MNIIPSTVTVYTLELTDQDVADILVAPDVFQAKLRAARNSVLGPRQKRKSLHLGNGGGDAVTAKKDKARRGPAPDRRSVPCPHCQRLFAGQGWLDKHVKKVHPDQ